MTAAQIAACAMGGEQPDIEEPEEPFELETAFLSQVF
jgi:hypothetical protein